MSARRQARARDVAEILTDSGGAPRCLKIGRCIEVWADSEDALDLDSRGLSLTHASSAMRRFSDVREWWLHRVGIPDRESWQTIPGGAPWSAHYVSRTYGGAQKARADAVLAQLGDLRTEVLRLYDLSRDYRAERMTA